jgi:hypothetical protein
MPAECALGGRFSRCKRPSDHSCQYCGRNFCSDHTHYLQQHEAVCTRKECVAKQQDMLVHTEYRRLVGGRNSARLCGVEQCEERPASYECSLCQGHFCTQHVQQRLYWTPDGLSRRERALSLCEHCWKRRKIWQRR